MSMEIIWFLKYSFTANIFKELWPKYNSETRVFWFNFINEVVECCSVTLDTADRDVGTL